MKHNIVYVVIISIVFVAFTIILDTFPRSTVSEVEKRELAKFPTFTIDKLKDGSFTREVSSWFSDSEPYRDKFMSLSMNIKAMLALSTSDEDKITFHANTDDAGADAIDPELAEMERIKAEEERKEGEANRVVGEYNNKLTANENAKIAHKGIIVIGSGTNVRALMAYGGTEGGGSFAKLCNTYKKVFGPGVNVYCMVIPTAVAYYLPEKARDRSKPQDVTINYIHSLLDDSVKAVDVYTTLGKHADEDIYLRTDHHWAPLGAYYAAQRLAKIAKLPFKGLDSYDRHVIHGYVGSMYGYSKDIAIKNAPEDFVYHTPKDMEYTTTYIKYETDEDYNIISGSKPSRGEFYYKYKDGSSGAYCTFMGGDQKITQLRTQTNNGRRLAIIKDSYGNPLASYLMYSFEEIHVIDYRYFAKNMKKYIRDNKITDIVFATSIFKSYESYTARKCESYLDQEDMY